MDRITKAQARQALGVESDNQLAIKLGITRQAVEAWGDDDSLVPQARQWQVEALVARQEAA